MDTAIAAVVIVAVVALAALYIIRAKKRGAKCIGCPYGEACAKKSAGGCCQSPEDEQ